MNRFRSIFGQLPKLFPRLQFDGLVKAHRADHHARGFTCWEQFVAMLFCQLGRAQSLREICGGLASCEGQLVHLGVATAPRKSTLACANAHRPWQLYRAVFTALLARCQAEVARGEHADVRVAPRLRFAPGTTLVMDRGYLDFAWFGPNFAALVRMNLFVHRDLWRWLDQPFTAPPDIPEAVQAELAFA